MLLYVYVLLLSYSQCANAPVTLTFITRSVFSRVNVSFTITHAGTRLTPPPRLENIQVLLCPGYNLSCIFRVEGDKRKNLPPRRHESLNVSTLSKNACLKFNSPVKRIPHPFRKIGEKQLPHPENINKFIDKPLKKQKHYRDPLFPKSKITENDLSFHITIWFFEIPLPRKMNIEIETLGKKWRKGSPPENI